jgi:hypothetical protein
MAIRPPLLLHQLRTLVHTADLTSLSANLRLTADALMPSSWLENAMGSLAESGYWEPSGVFSPLRCI